MIRKITLLAFIIQFSLMFAQELVTVTPNKVRVNEKLTLSIIGSGTNFTAGSATVRIKYAQGTGTVTTGENVNVINDETITTNITLYNWQVQYYGSQFDLSVESNGNIFTLENAIHVVVPEIKSVTPNTGNAGEELTLSILGENTRFSQGSYTAVYLNTNFNQGTNTSDLIRANDENITSDSTMTATITIPEGLQTGDYALKVSNSADGNLYYQSIHINGSSIHFAPASPSTGISGKPLELTIIGKGIDFEQATSINANLLSNEYQYNWSNRTLHSDSIHIINDTTLKAKFILPLNLTTSDWNFELENGSGLIYNTNELIQIKGSELSKVSPAYAMEDESLELSIIGSQVDFQMGTQGNASVYLRQKSFQQGSDLIIYAEDFEINTPNEITANFDLDNYPTGYYDVEILDYTKFGKLTLAKGFYVNEDLGGNGIISGNISEDEDGRSAGDPIEELKMYLINNNGDTVAMAITDENGYYVFKNLPEGSYTILIEGINNNTSTPIIIDQDNLIHEDVDLEIDENGIVTYIKKDFVASETNIYPNPFNKALNIEYFLENASYIKVEVYNILGELIDVLVDEFQTIGLQQVSFRTHKNSDNIYFIKINTDKKSTTHKVIQVKSN